MSSLFESLKDSLRGSVLKNEPMAAHTSWRVGGPADLFIQPADREDVLTALRLLKAAHCPWLAIGSGSNLLVRDGGIRGAVLNLANLRQLQFQENGRVVAETGLPVTHLIRLCVEKGLKGMEAMAGIPGSLGGAIAMNAGAGGQEMAGVVTEVVLATPEGEISRPAAALSFAYRRCELPPQSLLVEATLAMTTAEPSALQAVYRERMAHRRQAHAVGGANAGSVFKNPTGRQAWRLIDEAGLRGASQGGAKVSERHTNFIVNTGTAKARDILSLIDQIRERVRACQGVNLEPEVKIIGSDELPARDEWI
ncbi:MAG: UDP-N-acetylmuramate dehydrogenase [Desulfuromonadales bacterium]|nr:UDP-N-acetylmuramate dehydrogenase [Desulfuromonadales bacterium]MDW7756393.1 UDP-N-acetylmuramate dehydrogenase [Desulfuromonadales bacterium]